MRPLAALLLCLASQAAGWAAESADRDLARRYAQSIIALSDLRASLDQLERLARYSVDSGLRQPDLEGLRADVSELSAALETDAVAPRFRELDYDALDERLEAAARQAGTLRRAAVRRLAKRHPWWRPEPEPDRGPPFADTSKEALAKRFLVFPLLLSGRRDFYGGDEDWGLIRACGFGAVCPWVGNWTYDEPAAGQAVDEVIEQRLSTLDALITRNADEGLKTSIWVEPDDIAWALEAEIGPEAYLHAADGTHYRRSRIHNSVNIWHPEVRAALARFMTALGERYRDNPNVICYELFEEPALVLSNPRPEPGSALVHLPGGYSDAAKAAFREWLVERYESLGALNAAWGAALGAFDEVQPPAVLSGEAMERAHVLDFCRFRDESHARFFAEVVGALQHADPVHAVVPQYLPMFFATRGSGSDPFLMADAGWDFYATHDWPGLGPAYETALTASAAHWAGKPLWNEEYIWPSWVRREQGEEALWAGARCGVWRQFAWGKRALELFSWEAGWETEFEGDWNNGLLNRETDLAIPRWAVGVFPGLARRLDTLAPTVYGTDIDHDGLGMLVPTTTLLAADNPGSTAWWSRKLASVLLERHWQPLFFPEGMVLDGRADLSRFRVIVAPPSPLLADGLRERLLDWAESGGVLIWLHELEGLDELVEGAPSAFRAGVSAVERGSGALIRLDMNQFNQENELLHSVLAREYPVRAVDSPSRGVEMLLRHAGPDERLLFVVSLDVEHSNVTMVDVGGTWPRVEDVSISGGAPVPVEQLAGVTRLLVRLGPGEGCLLRLRR